MRDYNAGELVTGSTAPLWTALAALLFLLPGSPVLWIKLWGLACHLGGLCLTYRLARELGLRRGLASLSMALTLATSWLLWSSISGLEIPLFVLLSLFGIVLHLRERRSTGALPRSLVVLAASALVRPEGLLLVLLAACDRLIVAVPARDGLALRRPDLSRWAVALGGVALVVVPMILFNFFVGGSALPTTFAAKVAGTRSWLPDTGYIYTVLSIFLRPQPVLVFTCGAGVLALVERLGGERDRGLLPALWLVGLPLAYSIVSPTGGPAVVGNFGRYFFPLFPLFVVLGVLGIERAWGSIGPRLRIGGAPVPVRALLLVALFLPTSIALVEGAGRYLQSVGNVHGSDVEIARWLKNRLPAGAVLAVNDIGALKYQLPDHEILDLAGIVNPEVRTYMAQQAAGGAHPSRGVAQFLDERRPDYLVVFPNWFPALTGDPQVFPPLFELEIADNITMGGDRIVVFQTPWTRAPLTEPGG